MENTEIKQIKEDYSQYSTNKNKRNMEKNTKIMSSNLNLNIENYDSTSTSNSSLKEILQIDANESQNKEPIYLKKKKQYLNNLDFLESSFDNYFEKIHLQKSNEKEEEIETYENESVVNGTIPTKNSEIINPLPAKTNNFNNLQNSSFSNHSVNSNTNESIKCFLKKLYKVGKKVSKEVEPEKEDLDFIFQYRSSKSLLLSNLQEKETGLYLNENLIIVDYDKELEENSDFNLNLLEEEIKEEVNEHCCICMCNFKESKLFKIVQCCHIFHKKCLLEWLKYNKVCPIDKKPIK